MDSRNMHFICYKYVTVLLLTVDSAFQICKVIGHIV